MKNYAVVLGARPNFVKAAPFFRELKKHSDIRITLIHTGQHFDENMSKIFFDDMEIPKPDIFLGIKSELHTEKIGRMFSELRDIFKNNSFDAVIIFGDVNSTLAGAVGAMASRTNIIHIESGLRSHDRRMPEEINRVIVDHLSSLLFTTEPSANENLIREGIPENIIKYVGNLMIESLEIFKDNIEKQNIVTKLGLESKEYYVATIHRQENTDSKERLEELLKVSAELSKQKPIVLSLHPGTKQKIIQYGIVDLLDPIIVTEPLGYFEFMKLVSCSGGVITDSGGIQEETSHLGIPCCTLRDNTERPITTTHGSNKLFPSEQQKWNLVLEHLNRRDFVPKSIPLWDARVSERIFSLL
jgi:UDP-N-acetylglucosamine 2-epimerase (non-hydrolysing)